MRRKTRWPISGAVLAVVLSACSTTSHVMLGQARAPVPVEQVVLYRSPPQHYAEIALIKSSSRHSWTVTEQGKLNKAIERMKAEAAALGANGLLLQSTQDEVSGSLGTGSSGVSGNVGIGIGLSVPITNIATTALAIHVHPADEEHPPQ